MFLYLVGTITTLNPSFAANLANAEKLPKFSNVEVYISSNGGRIDDAFKFGRALSLLNATCYVEYAASAAFQVVMPACRKIIMVKTSRMDFHGTTFCIEGMRDTANMLEDLRTSLKINALMADLMEGYWGQAVCSAEIKKNFPELNNFPCSVTHMTAESALTPQEFMAIFPQAAKRVTIVPRELFPTIVKLPAVNDVKPQPNSKCEVY
jgi:ATP-dependent protease ClpP protease subunit